MGRLGNVLWGCLVVAIALLLVMPLGQPALALGPSSPQGSADSSLQLQEGGLVHRGDRYILQLDDLEFEVDPTQGARITSFSRGGKNVLTSSAINAQNYGSTFWPSPQARWGWPPVPEIDSQPYRVMVEGSRLVMESEVSPELKIQVRKAFSINSQRSGLSVEYTIINLGDEPQSFAPWEISRIHTDGLIFFPTGEAELGSGDFDALAITQEGEMTWFEYDGEAIQANQKLYADGAEGWLAHSDGELLLLKVFEDIPIEHQALAEGEIEIFANTSSPYIEIEQQGSYAEIEPQGSLSWSVEWLLQKLPTELSEQGRREQLAMLARNAVSGQDAFYWNERGQE